jgi:hypothetical protein
MARAPPHTHQAHRDDWRCGCVGGRQSCPCKEIETAGKKGGAKKAPNGTAAATSSENGTGEQLDEHGFVITGGPKVPTGMLTLQEPVDVPPIPEGLTESASKEPPENISAFFDGTVAG